MKSVPASDLCDPPKTHPWHPAPRPFLNGGDQVNHPPWTRGHNPGNLCTVVSFIFYDLKIQVPKSLHDQEADRVANHREGRRQKRHSPTSNKGNSWWPKGGTSLSKLSSNFHSYIISGKWSLARGRIKMYVEAFSCRCSQKAVRNT